MLTINFLGPRIVIAFIPLVVEVLHTCSSSYHEFILFILKHGDIIWSIIYVSLWCGFRFILWTHQNGREKSSFSFTPTWTSSM